MIRRYMACTTLLAIAGCGATLTDPLAIKAMAERCSQQYEQEGRVSSPVLPVLPILACR